MELGIVFFISKRYHLDRYILPIYVNLFKVYNKELASAEFKFNLNIRKIAWWSSGQEYSFCLFVIGLQFDLQITKKFIGRL